MSRCLGPFEVYSLGAQPLFHGQGLRFWMRWNPIVPRVKRLNAYGPPLHGFVIRWLRFGFVAWFPVSLRVWRAK
jgi:hypothetical protein